MAAQCPQPRRISPQAVESLPPRPQHDPAYIKQLITADIPSAPRLSPRFAADRQLVQSAMRLFPLSGSVQVIPNPERRFWPITKGAA